MELSEERLIEAIARVLSGEEPGVVVGMGDDAAVVRPGSGEVVLSTDLLVEKVHFERDAIAPRDLGAKAIVVNLSDLAAMAASPRYALVALGLPADVEAAWVVELVGGMRDACAEHVVALVGGDTSRADLVVISVAVTGEVAPGRALTRSGARPGDALVVTGWLGAAAGGLAVARSADPAKWLSEDWGRELARALDRPAARVGEAQVLAAAGATAMIDLSDGLAKDLSRLCRASGVGARVRAADVPVAPALLEGAEALGVDPLRLALAGGEDYELLATIPPGAVEPVRSELRETFGVPLAALGEVVEGQGVTLVADDGTETPLAPDGWDHFA
jgi:thiamine-monophosphate kinase